MQKLEKTPRENIRVKYYPSKKGDKKVITAQLTDEQGVIIQGARASYTLQQFDLERDGKIAARSRALQKMDEMFRGKNSASGAETKMYYSDLWNNLSHEEKRNCIAERCSRENTQKSAISYFENNALPQLDRYGLDISEDQKQKVVDHLYHEMLMKKNYKYCFVTCEEAININTFFADLTRKIRQSWAEAKNAFGHPINRGDCDELLAQVKNEVLKEQRLRSLLENWLRNQKMEKVIKTFWDQIMSDEMLLDLVGKKGGGRQALEKIILMLRILCGNEIQTKNQVNAHVREINCILRGLCLVKANKMPLVALPEYPVEKAQQIELCKELTWEQGVRFAALCTEAAGGSSYACGGLAMLTSGPRIAELCAILFGEIVDMGDWGVAMINYTADGDIRKEEGKNIYFHRPIFFPKIVMDAIHIRQAVLRKQGRSDAEIAGVYLVSHPNNVGLPANPQDFSLELKRMLHDAGCGEGYWVSVERAIVEEKDFDFFNVPETSLAAYGLRRHATTMMCNIAKMDPLLVDAILGHRLPRYAEDWTEKIRRDDEWPAIIEMMERVVYDPAHTRNPAFSTIELGKDVVKNSYTVPYQAFELAASCACKVAVLVRTVGNAEVQYNLPITSKQRSKINAILGTNGPYCSLSPLYSRGEYDSAKRTALERREEAENLDKESDFIGEEENCSY